MNRLILLLTAACLIPEINAQELESDESPTANAMIMQQMQGRMQAMRQQMDRIHSTNDPEERQQLMQEHMVAMHSGMQMMATMMSRRMNETDMRECAEEDAQCRIEKMEAQQSAMDENMGMMRMMMEQVLQQLDSHEEESEGAHEEHH